MCLELFWEDPFMATNLLLHTLFLLHEHSWYGAVMPPRRGPLMVFVFRMAIL